VADYIYLTLAQIQIYHDFALHEHGGLAGVLDFGLLESAFGSAEHLAYYEPTSDVFDLADA
jgi:prophage maintenance system killer protein